MILGVGMLTGDADDRAVGHRRQAQSGDRVGQAAARGYHAHAGLARHPRVGVGGIGGGLLVTHVDELDFVRAQLGENRKEMTAID